MLRQGEAQLQVFRLGVRLLHLHPNQNPRLEKDSKAPKWQAVSLGKGANKQTYYKQEVNKTKMLLFGQRIFEQLLTLGMEADTEAEDDDSGSDSGLLRRDYSFVRNGARKDSNTVYTFIPASKETKLVDKVKEAVDKLGSLEDAALSFTVTAYSDGTNVPKKDDDAEAEEIEGDDDGEGEDEGETEVPEQDFENL